MAFPQEQRDNKYKINNLSLNHHFLCNALWCGNSIGIKEVNFSEGKTIMLLKMLSCFCLGNAS